jgi:hypothetical protein
MKKYVLMASHLTITRQMISSNVKSPPAINSHLPIDQAGGEFEITGYLAAVDVMLDFFI